MRNAPSRKRKSLNQHAYLLGSKSQIPRGDSLKTGKIRGSGKESYLTRRKSRDRKIVRKLIPLDENVEKMMTRARRMLFSEKIDCFGNVKEEYRRMLKTENDTDLRGQGGILYKIAKLDVSYYTNEALQS